MKLYYSPGACSLASQDFSMQETLFLRRIPFYIMVLTNVPFGKLLQEGVWAIAQSRVFQQAPPTRLRLMIFHQAFTCLKILPL